MIKVTILIGALLCLANESVLKPLEERNAGQGCKSETELWGSEDGTKFYFCLGENQVFEESCPTNTFFINNSTVSGCIPFDKVDDNCITHTDAPHCDGIALYQPQPHEDPTRYYYCTEKGAKAKVGECGNATAFISGDGWLGCVSWSEWRKERGCVSTE